MRKTVLRFLVVVVAFGQMACAQKSSLEIPAGESIELDYPSYDLYELQLKGKLGKGIKVRVVDKTTGAFIRGFGLGPLGKVERGKFGELIAGVGGLQKSRYTSWFQRSFLLGTPENSKWRAKPTDL